MNRIEITDCQIINFEPRGYSTKYWIDANGEYLVKYNNNLYKDADLMESLASAIFKEINIDVVNVQLGYVNIDKAKEMQLESNNCCIVESFLTKSHDISIDLASDWVYSNSTNNDKNIRNSIFKMIKKYKALMAIEESDVQKMEKDYIRMLFGDCIINNEDRQIKNICVIYNENSFKYSLAPAFDNALAFHSYTIESNQPECYIGKQTFEVKDVVKYLVTHHYEYISDIINQLDDFISKRLPEILKQYNGEIEDKKIVFIYNYINEINEYINSIQVKKIFNR